MSWTEDAASELTLATGGSTMDIVSCDLVLELADISFIEAVQAWIRLMVWM